MYSYHDRPVRTDATFRVRRTRRFHASGAPRLPGRVSEGGVVWERQRAPVGTGAMAKGRSRGLVHRPGPEVGQRTTSGERPRSGENVVQSRRGSMFDTFRRDYVCERCGGHFGLTRLRRHFEKWRASAGSGGGMWRSGEQSVLDYDGRGWCPECFPDPESIRRGHRSVVRRTNAQLTAPSPRTFTSYGSE